MTNPFPILEKTKGSACPVTVLRKKDYATWLKRQPAPVKNWLTAGQFKAEAGTFAILPGKDGKMERVLCVTDDAPDTWSIAHLPARLPPQTYRLEGNFSAALATQLALGWALACYRFTRYKKNPKEFATLIAPKGSDVKYVRSMAEATHWARDLINTPANDMHPRALANEAAAFAKEYGGNVTVLSGEQLLKNNWPTVYAVGKASSVPPHVVDMRFVRKGAPKVTLVGKGVCFDTGGLDIKSPSNMRMMKKDMAGVAIMMALGKTILDAKIPVQLRLILPIVENAVGGNATRPLDIIKTRKGITVEIGDTDAEGRLILCDALFEADEEKPDLLIDCTTLTGAARVAVGTEITAFFTSDDKLAASFMRAGEEEDDPVWRLPLWKPYRSFMDSHAADISNDSSSGYAGSITAALYLQEFVSKTKAWLHLDMMAWNLRARPGQPVGAEAMALRALHRLVKERYRRKDA